MSPLKSAAMQSQPALLKQLIQVVWANPDDFCFSRAGCQQSWRRGNSWLEGYAKHLQAVMASTNTTTCRPNICLQLFIKDNWYISMVMCLAVHDTGFHLRHYSLKLRLLFLSFPLLSPAFTVSFAVGKPPAGLKVEWDGVEKSAKGEDCTGAFLILLSLSFCGLHGLACYQLRWGHRQEEPQMELIVGSMGSFMFRCRILLLGNCSSPSQVPICGKLHFQTIIPWHYSPLMSQTIEQVKSAETWNELSL